MLEWAELGYKQYTINDSREPENTTTQCCKCVKHTIILNNLSKKNIPYKALSAWGQ